MLVLQKRAAAVQREDAAAAAGRKARDAAWAARLATQCQADAARLADPDDDIFMNATERAINTRLLQRAHKELAVAKSNGAAGGSLASASAAPVTAAE